MIQSSFLGFGWLRPELLWWALAGLALALLGGWAVARRARAVRALVSARQLERFVPDLSHNRPRARFLLAGLALAFLALAAAGPVRGHTLREVRRRGLDIVVCVDTSRSMLVRDLRPDRMSRARREVRGLIDRLRGDRMALIAFAGDAREVAPLTHDQIALATLLESVTPAENEKGGTDLGAALERALALFDGRTGAHECVVVLTDGEDLEGRGLEVARGAGERGVKVFVVGMGTEAGGKIPLDRPDGGESFLRDKQGQEVVSTLQGGSLEAVAKATGGDYLPADASAAPLEELYDKRISRLEARDLRGGQEFVPHDRFQWFLGLGAGAAILAAGLRERRARARGTSRSRGPRSAGRGFARRGGPRGPETGRPSWARGFAPWIFLALPQGSPATPAPPLPAPPAQAAAAEPSPAQPSPAQPSPAQPSAAQPSPAQPPAKQPPAKQPPAKQPYGGSLRQGLGELRAVLEKPAPDSGALEQALALATGLAAKPLSDDERALVFYHRGALLERAGRLQEAARSFAECGGLADPGSARLDAWYNAGTCLLSHADGLFLAIPEVRESRKLPPLAPVAPAAPAAPAAPGAAPAPGPSAPADPNQDLEAARSAFEDSTEALTLRLRADWHDLDTRANLELARKRLRELDEIAKRREQEEQQEDQKDPKQDEKQKDPKEQDPEKQEPKQDQEGQDSKPQDPEKQDPAKQDPQQKETGDPKEKPEQPAEPPPEPKDGEQKQEPQPTPAGQPEERELSKEEVLRLFDQLADIERQAKELQARIRATRRQPVEKDW